jgi:hypothetical protein
MQPCHISRLREERSKDVVREEEEVLEEKRGERRV